MPLTDAQRQLIRACSKDDAAFQQLLALYEDLSAPPPAPVMQADPLHDSRHMLERILATIPGLVYVFDAVNITNLYANEEVARWTGYSTREVQDMGTQMTGLLIHPDDRDPLLAQLKEMLRAEDGELVEVQYRLMHRDGHTGWFQGNQTIFSRNPDGTVRQFLGITLNVTRLKMAEEAFRERQHFFSRIMTTIPDVVYVLDVATRKIDYTNQDNRHEIPPVNRLEDLADIMHPEDRAWIDGAVQWYSIAGDDDALEVEYRVKSGSGEWRWMYGRQIIFSRNADGSAHQVLGIAQDITLRKAAVDALVESENRQNALLKAMPDLLFLVSHDGFLLGVTAPEPELLYAPPDEMIGKHLENILPSEVATLQLEQVKLALETGRLTSCEYDLTIRGERHSFEARLAASDANTVVMMVRDVTRYRQIIEALTESEYRQKALLEAIPDLMFVLDRNGTYLDYYASQPQLLYSPPEEFLGRLSTDFLPETLAKQEMAAIQQVLETREPINYDYQLNIQGKIYDFESRMVAHSEDTVLLMVRDITRRRQTEARLHAVENRERVLLKAIPDTMFVFDREGTYLEVYAPSPDLLFLPADELIGKRMSDILPPHLSDNAHYVRATLETGQMQQYEYSINLPKGQAYFEVRMVPRDTDTVLSIVRDITARKSAEIELRHTQNREQALLKAIPDMIFVVSRDGIYLDYQAPDSTLLAAPPEQFLGKSVRDIMPNDDVYPVNQYMQYIEQTLATGQMVSYEYTLTLADGKHHFEGRMVARDADSVVVIVRDVTDRRQAEMVLIEGEKLQVALQKEQELNRYKNRLMMTLNHELRTPLAIIGTNSALLERYGSTMPIEKQYVRLKQIQKQTQHIGAIMDNIHMVLQGQTERVPPTFTVFDLEELSQQKTEALQSATGTAQNLMFFADGQLRQVYTDERLVDAILINLLTNALKYSPPESTVSLMLSAHGDGAVIKVSDEGIGIFPEDITHIFEPFFRGANSGDSGGLGLGMSIVKDAVDTLSGTVDIESTPGRGTTFTITLPGIRTLPADRKIINES